jgi:hypothetical protein
VGLEMFCRSSSFFLLLLFTNDKTTEGQSSFTSIISQKKERNRKENCVCVCMRHMELLVVDTRRQAAVID